MTEFVIPVELFACSYNDGKGSADLDKVIDKWNAWTDKNGIDDYAAWTLTPYYFGPEQEFDVIWMGAGKGASFAAFSAAMGEWSQHLTDAGSTTGIWAWYPAYGGGSEEFSFKWLQAHNNLADLGADYESFGNGGGYVTHSRLFGHLINCDSTRAYVAQSRRFMQLR